MNTLHLLTAQPSLWPGFWPQLLASQRPQDGIMVLGEATFGLNRTELQDFSVLYLLTDDLANLAYKNSPALIPVTAQQWAHLILEAQRTITWR